MNVKMLVSTTLVVLTFAARLFGDEAGNAAASKLPENLLPRDAKVSEAALVCFLEGPAADKEGNLFFSDIVSNRILKMSPQGDISVFRHDSGRTNGNCFDTKGRLISCEGFGLGPGGRRRIVRTDMKTGQITVVTDRYEGKRYNSPNDICCDASGRIWFTDPRFGERDGMEMEVEGVYRVDPTGRVTRVLGQPEVQKPNGIAAGPDGKTLFVVDAEDKPGGNRKIWAFEVSADGALSGQRLIHDFGQGRGGDGLRIDMQGNIWVAAGIITKRPPGEVIDIPQGIYVFDPHGKMLGRIPIPEDFVTNLAFGGPDRKTLYVTAGKSIYKVPVAVSGYAAYPPLH